MWFVIALLSIPVIEIALFILVGGWIGLWPTLALVILAFLSGLALLRAQGQNAMQRLREGVVQDSDPSEQIVRGAMSLMAGMLLIIPGFLTDLVAITLLIPAVQSAAFAGLRRRARMQGFTMGMTVNGTATARRPADTVIEAEFEEISPPKRPTHTPSGWTQH
jgi:UPF0716 protein FxsA